MIPVLFLTAICMSRQVRPVLKSVRADRLRQDSGHSFTPSPIPRDCAARTHRKAQQHNEEPGFGEDWVEEARRNPDDCSSDNRQTTFRLLTEACWLEPEKASVGASRPTRARREQCLTPVVQRRVRPPVSPRIDQHPSFPSCSSDCSVWYRYRACCLRAGVDLPCLESASTWTCADRRDTVIALGKPTAITHGCSPVAPDRTV